MEYKVIVDSCGELTDAMKEMKIYHTAPLSIEVDDHTIIDDESFDQADFLARVAASPNCPKSACPSPEYYMKSYQGDEKRVYAVTLSSELSGSYNSAVLGKSLYLEEFGPKDIYVFNSRSASVGETLIGMKIAECEAKGMTFEKVIETVEAYISGQNTYFVLETLETLRKNGRLTGIKALVASVLNIKPVMGANNQGIICQHSQARGIRKALAKMVDLIAAEIKRPEEKILGIAHCNCRVRAEAVKEMLESRLKLKGIFIIDTRGISSLYASDGGIIVTV
ncbi:MAG: DegV family protein [Lachnospiraceae bacterium]